MEFGTIGAIVGAVLLAVARVFLWWMDKRNAEKQKTSMADDDIDKRNRLFERVQKRRAERDL